jgi:hypothetical protein
MNTSASAVGSGENDENSSRSIGQIDDEESPSSSINGAGFTNQFEYGKHYKYEVKEFIGISLVVGLADHANLRFTALP